MLGWHISVHRLPEGTPAPPRFRAALGDRIAVWQAGLGGVDWLDALVTAGSARVLGGDGYPTQYAAPARDLLPVVLAGPPEANARWVADPGDVLLEGWVGRTQVDQAVAARCAPDEWLVVEVWDES